MIDLISIHIPRTAGTSFYQVLSQVYGDNVSISLRRKDINSIVENGIIAPHLISANKSVLHGHLYYSEIQEIHIGSNLKVICWLRDPVSRLISNYRFFLHGLQNPNKNVHVYNLNKHRINETLIEYAKLEENRNRMSKFLNGIDLEELFFFGILECFQRDLYHLSELLNWSDFKIPHLNNVKLKNETVQLVNDETLAYIKELNSDDINLYTKALNIKSQLFDI